MDRFVSIGENNERGNTGIRASFDPAHGEWPDHVDLVVPIEPTPAGGAHKIRVDAYGNIISDELV